MEKMHKQPVSVLVVIHTPDAQVLLLERADRPAWWQSVTGSQEAGETLLQTAVREVAEETGLDASEYRLTDWGYTNRYEIFPQWRDRYAPGVTTNLEHVFGLILPSPQPVNVSPAEHLGYVWMPAEAAAEMCFSPSNAAAIRRLAARF